LGRGVDVASDVEFVRTLEAVIAALNQNPLAERSEMPVPADHG